MADTDAGGGAASSSSEGSRVRWRGFGRRFADPKRISIVVGAAMALLGSGGQFFLVDSLSKEAAEIGGRVARAQVDAETLKNAQMQYFMTYQQGSIIFALDPTGMTKDKQVLGNLYRLNLINRTTPLRTMLGDMAMAGLLDYRQSYDAYLAVNEKAQKEFTWENYSALNEFERTIVDSALARQHALQQDVFTLGQRKAAIDDAADRRKLTLVLLSMLGTFLLLLANLRTK